MRENLTVPEHWFCVPCGAWAAYIPAEEDVCPRCGATEWAQEMPAGFYAR